MAVRAQYPEIAQAVVQVITVYVVQFERHGEALPLCPSALGAECREYFLADEAFSQPIGLDGALVGEIHR